MKKLSLVLMCIAALALTACGGKSGGSGSSGESESSNASGLAEGKWPAAIYDKYGYTEIPTKGHIVCTELTDEEDSYLYRVYYKGVTREELQAWVKSLKEKGYRIADWQQEKIDKAGWDSDIFLYQPEQGKDIRLRLGFDFEKNMDFEYYADEPNPAYEIVTRGEGDDEQMFIEYNFTVSLNKFKNQPETTGSFDALGVKAEDLAGIPNVRVVNMQSGPTGGSIGFSLYIDHQLAEGDFDAIHNKVADVFEAKGVKCFHTFSGKEMTAEQLKADKVRSYVVEKDGKKYQMMAMTDDRIGDFGGGITFRFMVSK
jgi:hypothetical protein